MHRSSLNPLKMAAESAHLLYQADDLHAEGPTRRVAKNFTHNSPKRPDIPGILVRAIIVNELFPSNKGSSLSTAVDISHDSVSFLSRIQLQILISSIGNSGIESQLLVHSIRCVIGYIEPHLEWRFGSRIMV